ncbi:uncharacterized protein LOC5566116 isoform X3 [Aedes aegypti]|uniref:Uncharacterized protein n=1 Tax=Aedes aegypti TaxID=7159 RepID=A0A6I8TAU6_AEDAE|nr:uncharacterized protein LOC5566116 isoform X3 [Aedes aegypti]XP_021695409.1 uncharacterized protein LOC5566116 isoform X3 [Aedes aegypti]XP_021695410.1 uncharacterized protein LOC5566116 isoform X3 [Aedes aegypti]XP_021695411.1 uncharacterized protein LOC5566116 isoform X3 [Aedes aegypti]XP_021695412.1 uncharacterized protein LOC5566116 isoform X3 [Aedes aegypti]
MFNELKFTPGVGFSLLIGAVGSIYLIVQSHRYFSKLSQRRRSEVRKPDVVCYMCNANIEVEDTNSFATCRGCERLVCRNEEKQCCEWIPAIGIWECQNCHSSRVIQQKAGEWLLNQLTSRLQNPGPVNLSNEGLLGLSTTDSDDARSCTSSVSSNQKVKVREFIEELLSSMLNGPLDDVSVGQLMENESYLKVFHRYHSRLSRCLYNLELSIHQSLSDLPLIEGQTVPSSPSDTHFELRKMLQKILDEVAKLPSLLNHSGFPLRPEEHLPYFSPKKYEQLLATAVLNKVVEDYRNPKNFEHVKPEADTTTTTTAGPPTTGATSAGSAPATGTTFDINHNKVPGKSLLNEANLRKMSLDKELKEDLYSRSLSESDESYLSDYIQKHTVPLPDLSDTTGSGPEDDVLSLKSNNTDGTWEENWLFKKRQLKSTESSIAMLVPSPTEEVKALIGDKNADEVSDLSEAGSDVEEYDSDSNLKNTTTGDTGSSPKKTLEDHTQDSLISINSIASNEPVLSEAKNELLLEEQQCAVENLVNDLISIEPCSMKTEAANPALIDSQSNAFLSGPESVLIEENNNVIKQEEVETDDIKLMQERIQNAPKQRDVVGNVLHPIGIARTIPVEGHSTECDRKEVPIDRAQSNTEHITRPFETVSEVDVDHPSNPRSNNFKPLQSNMESKSPTTPTIAKTLGDSKASAFVEPLSPRPIALNITEVFERSMNPPLTSISEEDHDRHTSTALQSTDSIISTTDESDSKAVSLSTTTVDTDSSLLLDSWVEIEHYKEDEFSLIDIANETSKQSLDLLELNEASTGAVYVCDTNKIQFAEQLRELRQQQDEQHQHALENEEITVVGEGEKIRLGQDLVAFNKNAPSPDELQEQCGENEAGLAIGECCTGLTTEVGIGNKLEHDKAREVGKCDEDPSLAFNEHKYLDVMNEVDKQECVSETTNVGGVKSQFVEELAGMIDQNEAEAVIPHFVDVSLVQNKDNVHEPKLLEYQPNESHGTDFITTSDDGATTMKQETEDLLDLTGSTGTSNESCTDQIPPTDNETFAEKVSSSSETTTSSVDSVVDLNAHNPIKTDEVPNQTSPVENRPSDESEQTELSSPTTSPVHNQSDILTGTNEALDASDNELPCQSGSSSPTDTSTEAVAGSVDRTSSPEDFYPSTSAIYNGQLKLQDDSDLEEREHSTPIAVVTQQMWQYCEELKGILYPRKAPEPVVTVSEKPPPTTENLQALLLFQEELRAANEDPSQTDIKPCKDHPIRMIPTDSSRTPVSESLPTPMEDFAARSAIYNQSIREVDCVEETIPVSEVVMDTPCTEEHVVEDTISTDFRDLSIQTIPTDSFSTSVSESLPTPMEDFALRSAEYNHSLRRMDYVEESIPVAEDATCLLTEHLEPSVANEIPTITPSVEEHAVQEAIIIEHTPTPEPIGAVSYERQVTTTVEELKADQEHNHDVLENSTETSKTVKESEVPISMEEKSQCHEPSIDDLQSLSNEKEVPIDVEVSSLVVSQPSVCVVLTNNGDTNLTNAVESDTNTLHDDVQSPSFTSEASIPIAEPDSYHCPPIPAQSEPEKQKPSETSNGHVPAVTTNGVSTDDSVEDEMLIPGSIAEREHLKWRNASPIPNNPYSPDVLQKRLEESNRRSSLIDFDRLASRDPTSPTLEVPDDSELPADSKEEDDAVENDRSLQSVLGANPNQYQRYGRDYYINDAKRACGSRKQTPDLPTQLTHSTDDEKSLLLSQKQEQPTSPISCLEKNDQQPTTEAFPFVKSSSCGNVADKNQSEDIFSAARPIEVKPDDPILKKGTKVEYLSTPAREIYLVPADEPTTPHSLGSSSELSMASRADESLTFSEDSDVTRIYEIGTGESKVIHGDIIGGEKDTGQTPPSTPTYGAQLVDTSHPIDEEQTMNKLNTLKQQESEVLSEEILGIVPQIRVPTPEPIPEEPSSPTIDRSHLLKPHLLKNKPLSPETIKFFSPKKPFSPNLGASSSLSQSTTEIRDLPHHPMNHYHSSLHIDYPPTRPAPIHHDFIIEKEVMEVLPSVKELAKCYSGSQQDVNAVPRPLHRPKVKLRKDFIRQSSDMLHEEQPQETRSGMPHVENKNRRMYCSTSSITAAEEIREGRRANVEAYNPPTFVPMAPGHSITARSLSKQIRDELKINATDDHKVQGGHTSPERPSSPVFAPGHLRSSIQFFESLREK